MRHSGQGRNRDNFGQVYSHNKHVDQNLIPLEKLFKENEEFDLNLFTKVFKQGAADNESTTPFKSDTNQLLSSLQHDFPSILTVTSLGSSKQQLLTVDAREFLKNKNSATDGPFEFTDVKPSIVLTSKEGEDLSSSMTLYSILNMIHGGVVNNNKKSKNLLM